MSFADFRPAPWLPGPHAQTIVSRFFPAPALRRPAATIDVAVAAGTKVRALVTQPAETSRGTLLVIHGLGGSADSVYMRRTAVMAVDRGWTVARLNLRNCGGTEAIASTLYNAGQSDDAGAVLADLESRGFPRPYALLGFSLGGNLAMRYAGLSGGTCRADLVAAVNPPVDLARCVATMERPGNALYHAYFTRSLCAHLARIRRVRSIPGPKARPRSIGGIRGFDDRFTAPDAGYASAADYYRTASAANVLSGVRRPALILSAKDDPFVPVSMFDLHREASPSLHFSHPEAGGHCGYWSATRPRFWAADAVLRFFEDDGRFRRS